MLQIITFLRARYILAALLLIAGIVLISLSISRAIEDETRRTLSANLGAILNNVHNSIKEWRNDQIWQSHILASNEQLVRHTQSLLKAHAGNEDLSIALAQSSVRNLLKEHLIYKGYRGFFLINPDGINIGSTRDHNLGVKNLMLNQDGLLASVFKGEDVLSRPMPSDVPLADKQGKIIEGYPTMFVATPIKDKHGSVIAALAFRINPMDTYSEIILRGRTGLSGETYIFDQNGTLLSESRFISQLIAANVLPDNLPSMLQIQVRDPGVNLITNIEIVKNWSEWPLTLMASSAINKGDGENLEGYRDYRGVPVIGVWHWHKAMGIGVTTEIDLDEAYAALWYAQKGLLTLTIMSSILVLVFAWYACRNNARTTIEKEAMEREKQKAEKASQAKSDFLSSMSHELRTPMNAILGFAQLLDIDSKSPLNKEQKESISHILKGGYHLLDLIEQVLELNKIDAGKFALSIEPVSPRQVINETISLIRGQAEERGISLIDQTTDISLPFLYTDQTRLKQMLINLLSNAIKYNQDGGTVTLSCQNLPEQQLRIIVTDTGIGIPKNKENMLFTPFERLGKEGSDIEGTGIGLSITQKIIELLGGKIGYDSEEGKGSSFWLDIPLSKEQEVREELPDVSELPDANTEETGSKYTVLYIEDNPENIAFMESMIETLPNIELASARSAEEGIELAENYNPDLILMDINLPGMSGIEATKLLGVGEKTRNIPIIAITAAAMKHDIEAGKQVGFKAYLTKPLDVVLTLNTIKETLNQSD